MTITEYNFYYQLNSSVFTAHHNIKKIHSYRVLTLYHE